MAADPTKLDYAAPDRTGRGAVEMLGDVLIGGAMLGLGVGGVLLMIGFEVIAWDAWPLLGSRSSDVDLLQPAVWVRDGWRRVVGRPPEPRPPYGRRSRRW